MTFLYIICINKLQQLTLINKLLRKKCFRPFLHITVQTLITKFRKHLKPKKARKKLKWNPSICYGVNKRKRGFSCGPERGGVGLGNLKFRVASRGKTLEGNALHSSAEIINQLQLGVSFLMALSSLFVCSPRGGFNQKLCPSPSPTPPPPAYFL